MAIAPEATTGQTAADTTNPWSYKPWWCQPWSIALTGISIISGSGWLLHWNWLAWLITAPVALWMGYFLLVWPRLMRQYLEAQLAAQQAQSHSNPQASASEN